MDRASRSVDAAAKTQAQRRPSVRQWIWYAFGGGLPPRLSQWVLRDNTAPLWWLRHFARSTLQMAIPVLLVAVLLPDGWDVKGYVIAFAVLAGYLCSGFVMWGVTEHRVVKAGFATGVAEQVREERGARRRGEID